MTEKIKAVGYARFSSSNQREESITAQKRYILMFAKRNNMEVIDWYCDEAKSAKTVNRPEFQRMIKDAQNKPEFQVVLVHKTDRFSRNLGDSIQYKKLLEGYNIQVIFVNERFEDNPESHLLYHIMSSVNQFYNENLAREVMKGMKENAYQCKWTGGRPPLGYDVDKNLKLVINEKEAEAVRLIFQMAADGYGYGETIDKLNILGYKTKKGRPFGKNSLYEIIRNEKYKGTYIFNRCSSANSLNKRNNHKYKPESEIIRKEGGCPAIVSSSLWHRANAVKKATRSSYTNAKNTYLLTGLIYCGECGAKFHGNIRYNKNNTNLVYRCSGRVNKRNCEAKEIRCEYLDSFVIDKFVEFFFNDENISLITQQLNEKYNNACKADVEYNEIKTNLKVLEKSRNNLVEAIAQTGINETISAKIKEYEYQISNAKDFIHKYEERKINRVITEDEVREQINQLKEYFYNPENITRTKYVLSQYIERIDITNETVQVKFKMTMPPSDNSPSDGEFFCLHTERIKRKHLLRYNLEKSNKKHRNIEIFQFFPENRNEKEFFTNTVTEKSHDCIYNRDFSGTNLLF